MSTPRPDVDSGYAEIGIAVATYLPAVAAVVLVLVVVRHVASIVDRLVLRRSRGT